MLTAKTKAEYGVSGNGVVDVVRRSMAAIKPFNRLSCGMRNLVNTY